MKLVSNERTHIQIKRGCVILNSKEELQLVKKAMKGNTKAYGDLVHYYQDYLYKTAFLMLRMKTMLGYRSRKYFKGI